MFKKTQLLFIKTKRYDDVRSSEKCEAHLLQLFALFHFTISPVPCTSVVWLFEFSKNRRLWSFEVYLNLLKELSVAIL
jgi:hypothetical protein